MCFLCSTTISPKMSTYFFFPLIEVEQFNGFTHGPQASSKVAKKRS